jgi:hypothetical protein
MKTYRNCPLKICAILEIILTLTAVSCATDPAPKGFYVVRNDIMDKEFNTVVIDQVTAGSAMTSFSVTLTPGKEIQIPYRRVTGLRFTRRYRDFSRVYLVKCPAESEAGVTLKLIDVHLNRLGGGCVLQKKGERKASGSIEWEKVE